MAPDTALSLDRLLMRLNVLTVFRPLSSHFSGMAVKTPDNERYILINSSHAVGKQHFTICHELYHLFVQRDFNHMVCNTGLFNSKGDRQEYYADLFAANLLMPEDTILEMVTEEELADKQVSLESIIHLEQYLGSSRSALLYRLQSLGYLDKKLAERYRVGVKKSAVMHGKPVSLYEPDYSRRVIGNYGDMAKQLVDAGRISEGHYSGLITDLGVDLNIEESAEDV